VISESASRQSSPLKGIVEDDAVALCDKKCMVAPPSGQEELGDRVCRNVSGGSPNDDERSVTL
jgi:hypothetical protein